MQTNIDYEISQLRDAVFGEDVRSAFISCMEKLHTVSETNANIVIEAERTMNEIRDNAVNALNNLTSKLETGEFIGPPGPQGLPGEKGDTGKTGNTGERGSKWMRGTAITGIDSNGVEFPNSDIENALAGDFFINTSTNDIYECVKSGNPSTAKWAYIGNIKGNKGDRGDVGPQGTVENIDDQILTFELAENLENVKSGETVKIAFGKLMKAVGAFIVHHTQKATTSILGHIKITNSAAVTDSTGLALAATEKNAAISGTLAHQIAQISAQNNDLTNSINQINSNLIIYRTWQFLTHEEEIIISPNETRYFGIEKPVVDGYTCIGVSLQEKHGGANGYLLVTYTETLMTVHNPRDADIYFWGAVFKFVYIKR